MLGLIINNFYLIFNNLKINLVISLLCLFGHICSNSDVLLFLATLFILVIVPCAAFSTVRDARGSNWHLIENQMPVKRGYIIASKYLIFALLLILAIFIILGYITIFNISLENPIMQKVAGLKTMTVYSLIKMWVIEAVLICALYFPLMYLFNTKNPDLVLTISVGISFLLLKLIEIISFEISAVLVVVLFVISFYLSCVIERYKE